LFFSDALEAFFEIKKCYYKNGLVVKTIVQSARYNLEKSLFDKIDYP